MIHIMVKKKKRQNCSTLYSLFFLKYASLEFAKQDGPGMVQHAALTMEWMKVPQWFSVSLITSLHHSGNIKLVKENSSRNIQISPIVFYSAATIHFNKYLTQLN